MTDTTDQDKNTVRLGSTSFIFAPGFLPYLANVWKTQPSVALDMLASYDSLPSWALPYILNEKWTTDGDVVVITKATESPRTPMTWAEAQEKRHNAQTAIADEEDE